MIITSPAGNRTPVSRVTGGDTHHYTTEDEKKKACCEIVIASNKGAHLKHKMENPGVDPGPSRMQSERSTR